MQRGARKLKKIDQSLQGCIRNNPEAFFAKNILICEGATEIGICRALNDYRISQGKINSAFKGIRFVDGSGSQLVSYAHNFRSVGYNTCLFCDSDVEDVNSKKAELEELGVVIVDCFSGNSIEMQVFKDLHWSGIQELIKYYVEDSNTTIESITQSMKSFLPSLSENWQDSDSQEIRNQLGKVASKKGWFKRIDHGIFVGEVCCKYLNEMEDTVLKKQFSKLSEWMDNA